MARTSLDPDAAAQWHGELLAAARRSRRLDRPELAGRLGWTTRRLHRVETGARPATSGERRAIADALDVAPDAERAAWTMTRGLVQPSPSHPALVEYWAITPAHVTAGLAIAVRMNVDPERDTQAWAGLVRDIRSAALGEALRGLLRGGEGILARPAGRARDGSWTVLLPEGGIQVALRDVHRTLRTPMEEALDGLTTSQAEQVAAYARQLRTIPPPDPAPPEPEPQGGAAGQGGPVMLSREQVYQRAGFARTAGYRWVQEQLETDPTFPRPIGKRWRLDHLIAWEDHHGLAGLRAARAAQAAPPEPPAPEPEVRRGPGRPRLETA